MLLVRTSASPQTVSALWADSVAEPPTPAPRTSAPIVAGEAAGIVTATVVPSPAMMVTWVELEGTAPDDQLAASLKSPLAPPIHTATSTEKSQLTLLPSSTEVRPP